MDRELPSSFKKKRLTKNIGLSVLLALGFFAGFLIFRQYMQPTAKRADLSLARVTEGSIEATLTASGQVMPEHEFLITSPIHAKIEQVLRHSGETVQTGQSILQLNKEETLSNYNKMLDEQAANHNREAQLELNLEKSVSELTTQYTIKQMYIQGLETALEHEQTLLKIGGSTEEKVKQAGLNLRISQLELQQLKRQMKNQQKQIRSDRKGLGYQISIQQKSIDAYGKKLSQAAVHSPAKGVITWVNSKIGAEVGEGAELARVADLSSYKIEGKIADTYAGQLKNGTEVIIRIEDQELRGSISNIEPEVDGGMVKFFVLLKQNNHPLLRSNLKVDLYVVTSVKRKVLRIKNGSAFTGAEQQQIFVLKGNEAIARTINVGISNFESIEVLSGLKAGEEVIISDLKDLGNVKKIAIKD